MLAAALRVDPESVAARQALTALESAADLPVAARTVYRFREAADLAKRAIWNIRMRGLSDQDLDATADLFGRLATADPTDSAAWFNRGLCLAWMGKNLEAISCLERVVRLEAEQAFELAVDAWTLAEVLRQGGGAETLADDLRFACTMAWTPGDTPWLLEEFPEIQTRAHAACTGRAGGRRSRDRGVRLARSARCKAFSIRAQQRHGTNDYGERL